LQDNHHPEHIMPKPNFELLKDAYAIIDGIPEKNINMDRWRKFDHGTTCGTVACAIGWFTLHPQFKALGLEYDNSRSGTEVIRFNSSRGFYAIGDLFNITYDEAFGLFGPAPDETTDHKTVALKRIREFLEKHGQLNWQLMDAAFAARDLALDAKARRKRA
jgi:hypothetical protein